MDELTAVNQIVKKSSIADLERVCLQLPQREFPTFHTFGPGLYIREVHFPAKCFVMGHSHKYEQFNVLLSGSIILFGPKGEKVRMDAPAQFTGKPGRKMAYTLTEVVWQNIHATELTDLDEIEDYFIEKSDVWKECELERIAKLAEDQKEIEG